MLGSDTDSKTTTEQLYLLVLLAGLREGQAKHRAGSLVAYCYEQVIDRITILQDVVGYEAKYGQ